MVCGLLGGVEISQPDEKALFLGEKCALDASNADF